MRGPVPCISTGYSMAKRDAVVDQAHLLIAGEQHEGAPAAGVEDATISSLAAFT
jgi:hypothetical protein